MTSQNTQANTANQESQVPAKVSISASQRFTNMVIAQFATNVSDRMLDLNDRERRIIQGYFVVIDKMLKKSEKDRVQKNKSNSDRKYDNNLAYNWNNINMIDLALDAVYYARIGLDMQEKNHLFPIPFADKKAEIYNITFMTGYSGIQYIAEKYAADPPKNVTIEVVYSNDHFKPLKKSVKIPIENYEFEIINAFDRGDIVGGFGYIEYSEPAKNKLIIMTKSAMDKRKPKKASPEFWGGTKNQKDYDGNWTKEELDGWQDEMYRKVLIREVFGSKHIPRDPSKIDDGYQYLQEREVVYAQIETENEATENANSTPIDFSQANTEPPPAQAEPLSDETSTEPTSDDNSEPPPQEEQAGYVQPDI
jgi:recombination protein RecT